MKILPGLVLAFLTTVSYHTIADPVAKPVKHQFNAQINQMVQSIDWGIVKEQYFNISNTNLDLVKNKNSISSVITFDATALKAINMNGDPQPEIPDYVTIINGLSAHFYDANGKDIDAEGKHPAVLTFTPLVIITGQWLQDRPGTGVINLDSYMTQNIDQIKQIKIEQNPVNK